MLFRAARGADAKAVAVAPHELHQVAAVGQRGIDRLERFARPWRVAPKRQHVGDALAFHPVEDPARFVAVVGAGQVGHRLDVVVPLDPRHQLQGLLAGAQAIGHRHPVGCVSAQRGDGPLEKLDLALVARGHELERHGRTASVEQLRDAHRSKPTSGVGHRRRGASPWRNPGIRVAQARAGGSPRDDRATAPRSPIPSRR